MQISGEESSGKSMSDKDHMIECVTSWVCAPKDVYEKILGGFERLCHIEKKINQYEEALSACSQSAWIFLFLSLIPWDRQYWMIIGFFISLISCGVFWNLKRRLFLKKKDQSLWNECWIEKMLRKGYLKVNDVPSEVGKQYKEQWLLNGLFKKVIDPVSIDAYLYVNAKAVLSNKINKLNKGKMGALD